LSKNKNSHLNFDSSVGAGRDVDVYLYYEHHRDATKKIVLTELVCSSYATGRLDIKFYDKQEKIIFETAKKVLKWPPLNFWSYDPASYVWSYFGQYGVSGSYGEEVIRKFQVIVETLGSHFESFEVEDLSAQAAGKFIDMNKSRVRPEDFFYNNTPVGTTAPLSKDEIMAKLVKLTGFSYVDKKSYRQAAMMFHPDRNSGDGSRMAELNMLWQQYNAAGV